MKIKGIEIVERTTLAGQSGNLFLFFLPAPRDEKGEVLLGGLGYPYQPVFIYQLREGKEQRSPISLFGSLANCNIPWETPTKEFSQEEIDRITNLPEVDRKGNPVPPQDWPWTRKTSPS